MSLTGTQTFCGKCNHPMHWRRCLSGAIGTAPCQCRNDVEEWLIPPSEPKVMTLDEAWQEAEAALPEGWFFGGLTNTAYRGVPERWLAQAYQGPELDAEYRIFKAAFAETPSQALHALAEALRSAAVRG